jgi:hypothetical protein
MFKWFKKLWRSYTIEPEIPTPQYVVGINNTPFTNEQVAEVFPQDDLGRMINIAGQLIPNQDPYAVRHAQQQMAQQAQLNQYQQNYQALYGVRNYQEQQRQLMLSQMVYNDGLTFQTGMWQEPNKKLTITECIEIMEKALWSSRKSPITKKDIL